MTRKGKTTMINGVKKPESNMLDILGAREEDFILTGSRAIHAQNEFSDWDFFTVEKPGLVHSLKALGFFSVYDSGYEDVSILDILRFRDNSGLQIDVQIVSENHLEVKILANKLYRWLAPKFRSKDEARYWWDGAMNFFFQEDYKEKVPVFSVGEMRQNKINAIKSIREYTGSSLVEAKRALDDFNERIDSLLTMKKS